MCNTTYDAVTMFRNEMYIFKGRVSHFFLFIDTYVSFVCMHAIHFRFISISICGESVRMAYIQVHRMKSLMYGIYRMI